MDEIKTCVIESKLYIKTPYNKEFIKKIKKLKTAKWDTYRNEWCVSVLEEEQAMKIVEEVYGFVDGKIAHKMKIRYRAKDFEEEGKIKIGNTVTVARYNPRNKVKFYDTTIYKGSSFPEESSDSDVLSLETPEDTMLESIILDYYYNKLSEDEKDKIQVICVEEEIAALQRRSLDLLSELVDNTLKLSNFRTGVSEDMLEALKTLMKCKDYYQNKPDI